MTTLDLDFTRKKTLSLVPNFDYSRIKVKSSLINCFIIETFL